MSDIDEVKSRLNIIDLIGEKIKLTRAGRNFKGLCPFHNEKTPSFMVSPERAVWHCFGCGRGGSVIDFVMEYERIDFTEALETLAKRAGVTLKTGQGQTKEEKLKKTIYEINHLASEYYHYILTKHALGEKARNYLSQRGVSDKTMRTFMLGYSPNSWEALRGYLEKKGYTEAQLSAAGVLIPSNRGGYDRFRGRVMFTLKDHRGNVVGFSGRLLDKNTKAVPAGRQEPKYINTSETPVYSKSHVLYGLDVTKGEIQKSAEAIIMEGEFDVISSFQAGIANTVAIKGSALTEGHVNLLRRFCEKLVFALDSDVAGDAAARRGIEIADRAGFDMRLVTMPSGKDPDDAVRENAPQFKKAVKDAMGVYDYFIQSALSRFDSQTAFGKKKISSELTPVLSAMENPIVQAHYIKKLAIALDVGEDVVIEGIKKVKKIPAGREPVTEKTDTTKRLNFVEHLEMYILAIILQTKTAEFMEELCEYIHPAEFQHPVVKRIIQNLTDFLKSNQPFFIKDFADNIPKELQPTLDEAFLYDLVLDIGDDEAVVREWTKAVRELRRVVIKKKIQDLTTILSLDQPNQENDSSLEAMQETLSKYTDELRTLEKSRVL
ncbi:DNA primase [Candidatus Gottesmanbacteria bacterium RBG_16_43_7]|uniref:DNA primase n=1 Tax=Candidatus Gottesmanbacteria bacterium RBG_16_43_7 TaxID=1798373 RepID=A0A1F5ZD81_9BACT|nr:MAG: DNA primase [Candidatus Gottesmanbacteria bacterium RBG_16_43_7]